MSASNSSPSFQASTKSVGDCQSVSRSASSSASASNSTSNSFEIDRESNSNSYVPVEHHWFYRRLIGTKKRQNNNANAHNVNPNNQQHFSDIKSQHKNAKKYNVQNQNAATWQPFSAQDSRRLEMEYKRLLQRTRNNSQGSQFEKKDGSNSRPTLESNGFEGEFVVATDGGRFDVDLVRHERRPVYWHDDTYQVRRCSWFYKRDGFSRYEPYNESISKQLEENYRACTESNEGWNRRFALSANELIVMRGPTSIVHYENCSTDENWLSMADNPAEFSENGSRQVHRGVYGIFNFDSDDSADFFADQGEQIDHLIFFIHGVGGVCDIRFRSCVEVVNDFRSMANSLLATAAQNKQKQSQPATRRLSFKSMSKKSRDSEVPPTNPSTPTEKVANPRRRIEFLPISWHSCTRRDTGINERLNQITLKSVPKLRQFLNKVIVDALLYSSGPVYCQTIIDNVGNEMNRLYSLFLRRNPNFHGSVSIAGHSLGSIIAFDLLANQDPWPDDFSKTETETFKIGQDHDNGQDKVSLHSLFDQLNIPTQYLHVLEREHINDFYSLTLLSDDDLKCLGLPLGIRRKLSTYINSQRMISMSIDARNRTAASNRSQDKEDQEVISNIVRPIPCMGQWLIRYPKLLFKPRCFFAFGSPMPMFLAVRGVHEIQSDFRLPTCERMINIFHPYDPLAYRIEPLIDPEFYRIKPVLIPHHRGGKRIHLQLRDGIAKVGLDLKHKILGSLKSTWSNLSELTLFGSQNLSAAPTPTASSSEPTTSQQRRMTTSSIAEESTPIAQSSNSSQYSSAVSPSIVSTSVDYSDDGDDEEDDDDDEEQLEEDQDESNASPHKTIGSLNGGRRLDYVLQEKPIEYMLNEYVFAFSSHASYWQNEDSAMVMLNEIYQVDDVQMFDYFV